MTAAFSNYSFVQFEQPAAQHCQPDPAFCLPMSDPAHWQFYLYITGLDTSIYPGVNRILYFAYVVPTDMTSPPADVSSYNPYTAIGATPLIFANHFNPAQGATMTVHYDYPWSSLSSHVEIGACFKLMIAYLPITTDATGGYESAWPSVFVGFTSCFQRIDTSCYTSVLTYSNSSDAFGFQYLWGKPNVVELPIYLRDPKMENDQKVYTKSDGSLVKLYERKEETYTLETDLMPYTWHKALDIALSHDSISIQNDAEAVFDPLNTAVHFVKKENYEIEYQKAPLSSLGKGSCKLSNANPIHLINNNCG